MAQPIVTPENLAQAVEEIKEAAGSGSGDSNFVPVQIVISNREDGEKTRLYLALDPSFDTSTVTLLFARSKRTNDRSKERKEQELPRIIHRGWHQVWAIPVSDKKPLFNLRLKSKWTEHNGKALYEVTSGDYDTLYEFLTDEENNATGYRAYDQDADELIDVIREKIVANSRCGIALVREGEIISNYAPFGGVYTQDGAFHLRKI